MKNRTKHYLFQPFVQQRFLWAKSLLQSYRSLGTSFPDLRMLVAQFASLRSQQLKSSSLLVLHLRSTLEVSLINQWILSDALSSLFLYVMTSCLARLTTRTTSEAIAMTMIKATRMKIRMAIVMKKEVMTSVTLKMTMVTTKTSRKMKMMMMTMMMITLMMLIVMTMMLLMTIMMTMTMLM